MAVAEVVASAVQQPSLQQVDRVAVVPVPAMATYSAESVSLLQQAQMDLAVVVAVVVKTMAAEIVVKTEPLAAAV